MARHIYGKSVKGASHIRNGTQCQDSIRIIECSDDLSIVAVADGHGSDKSPKSKNGSLIAVNVFCSVMSQYLISYTASPDEFITFLNRDGHIKIAKNICDEWQRRVRESYNKSKGKKDSAGEETLKWEDVYRLYGTTLLGLLVAKHFIFAFQIGDGDIVLVDKETVSPIVKAEKILGVETHSLSKTDAWRNAVSAVRRREADMNTPYLYMLSTDGFMNSFVSEEDYEKSCKDYYFMIRKHGFEAVCGNMGKWLNETSSLGCGDDITLALVYID